MSRNRPEASAASRTGGASARVEPLAERRRMKLAQQSEGFEFLESKIRVPPARSGAVSRTALVNRLRAADEAPVATVIAPAGYGKTTLLAQWAERDPREFAWVTLDERDNDPVVLLRHIAAALQRGGPVAPAAIDALQAPAPTIWSSAMPRVAAEVLARRPMVLVLDDFHVLRSRSALEAVAALSEDDEGGSLLVLAGRAAPRLALAPLRAKGRLLELGSADLTMSRREAELLVRGTGIRLSEAQMSEIVDRCEGWAAGLYLVALAIRDGRQHGTEAVALRGDDRYLADYFRSEYLSRLRPDPLRFLRRTSVLERMCGALCDAVLDGEGSQAELEKIERANLFLVPLDNRREWYRYHPLFLDLLRRELREAEPDLVPVLHARAADWFQEQRDAESALEHAFDAGDTDRAAAILAAIAFPVYQSGRGATLERWLRRFERAGLLERYPAVALHGARVHMLAGRAEEAERWLEAAGSSSPTVVLPAGRQSLRPWVAVLRAGLCLGGPPKMLEDARTAVAELPEESEWRPSAMLLQGVALLLLGEPEPADDALKAAAVASTAAGANETRVIVLGERALIAAESGHYELADALSESIQALIGSSKVAAHPARAVGHATFARTMLRHGRWNEAREAITTALDLIPSLTVALPWLAAQVRIELARGLITLRDSDPADELLLDVEEILEQIPGLERLKAQVDELRRELALIPQRDGGHQSLTPAELRLLPLLATHLSFREIAERLYVSRNTVKTQAISVYRKLGVSSRSEAVEEAHRMGLDEHLRVLVTTER